METREKLWLLGPGRRSEKTVFEQQLLLEPIEFQVLQERGEQLLPQLLQKLQAWRAPNPLSLLSSSWDADDVQKSISEIYSRFAIDLQRAAGHRVKEQGVEPDRAGQGCWVWFEYEHDSVAAAASRLAWQTLAELEPGLKTPGDSEADSVSPTLCYSDFLAFAEPLVLPADTEAFVKAARARNIPCVNLDRSPYEGVKGAFRVRNNSLLKLGHGARYLILDGSICISRSENLMRLLRDFPARRQIMSNLRMPLPKTDPQAGNCALNKHALRSAERIGFPVDLFVTGSNGQRYLWPHIAAAEELRQCLDAARRHGISIELQGSVAGEEFQILMVGKKLLALVHAGQVGNPSLLHPATQQLAVQLAEHLASDILLLKLRSSDISRELSEKGGVCLDFDLAPRLDEVLSGDCATLTTAAEAFVDLLVPKAAEFRIPIVTVTGTNGKTTTVRMIEAIARQSGLGTGMACTGANYLNGELVPWNERTGTGRQFRLLDKPEVQIAILEEFLGTIIGTGFAYTVSDVAVCCNVTEDHLGRLNHYDPADLAKAKAMVIKRARKAAVLNADNVYSLAMQSESTAAQTGLVSLTSDASELQKKLDRPGAVCVLEQQEGQTWLVLHDGGRKIELLPENEIPACFNGMARHNTANAMHAALACYLLGLSVDSVRAGLTAFRSDFASSPGRLNLMDGLPFKFFLDYAHNMDGFRALCDFVDQNQVSGRKMLCVAFAGDRQNKEIRQAITYLAAHFDYFVCRRYVGLRGREHEEIPRLIQQYLLEAGVPAHAIQLELDPRLAVKSALANAAPGDFLVVLTGSSEMSGIWSQAEALKAQLQQDAAVSC